VDPSYEGDRSVEGAATIASAGILLALLIVRASHRPAAPSVRPPR
jgi:hypothetical protein